MKQKLIILVIFLNVIFVAVWFYSGDMDESNHVALLDQKSFTSIEVVDGVLLNEDQLLALSSYNELLSKIQSGSLDVSDDLIFESTSTQAFFDTLPSNFGRVEKSESITYQYPPSYKALFPPLSLQEDVATVVFAEDDTLWLLVDKVSTTTIGRNNRPLTEQFLYEVRYTKDNSQILFNVVGKLVPFKLHSRSNRGFAYENVDMSIESAKEWAQSEADG